MQLEMDQRHLNAQTMLNLGSFLNEPLKMVNVATEWGYVHLESHFNHRGKVSVPSGGLPLNPLTADGLESGLAYAGI